MFQERKTRCPSAGRDATCRGSLARVDLCPLAAGVALDVAAPQELAVALPHPRVLVCVVAPPTAHQVAAVGVVHESLVADPPMRPHAARHRVRLAVARRLLDVHQVRIHGLAVRERLLDFEEGGALVAAGFDRFHVHRLQVLVLQDVAQLAELRQGRPASLGGAGTRHAVTLTLQVHVALQDLTGRKDVE